METEISIHTPQDSAISAYGIAQPGRPFILLVMGIVFAVLVIFFTLFAWLLSRPLTIAQDTPFFIIVRPKTLAHLLSTQTQESLPEPWKTSLQKPSIWPVVFGAHQQDGVWQTFTLAPRWTSSPIGYSRQTRGLIALTGAIPQDSTRSMSYGSLLWSWFTTIGSYAKGELLISPLSPAPQEMASSTIRFSFYKNRLETDLSFEHPSPSDPSLELSSAQDLSLDVKRIDSAALFPSVLHLIRWGDADLSHFSVSPTQLHASFEKGTIETKTVRLVFQEPLSRELKQELLAYMRVVDKQVIRLPDGSYASERRFPTLNGQTSSTYPSALGITNLENHSAEAIYQEATSSSSTVIEHLSPCYEGMVVARLSPVSVRGLTRPLSIHFPPELLPSGIQFIEHSGRLIICRE